MAGCSTGQGNVSSKNVGHRFAAVPLNDVKRCAASFEVCFLWFGGRVRNVTKSAAMCLETYLLRHTAGRSTQISRTFLDIENFIV